MSSNYLDEEELELLFLKGIPNIVCCKCLNSRITSLIIAYIQFIIVSYSIIEEAVVVSTSIGLYDFIPKWNFINFGGLANVFTSILLIIGLHKEKKKLIWIWLIISEVCIIETTIIILTIFTSYFEIFFFLHIVITVLAYVLITLIVHSYYLALSTRTASEQMNTNYIYTAN